MVGVLRVDRIGASEGTIGGLASGATSRASEVLGHGGGSDSSTRITD
jgi:hypothetical protein